MTEHHGAAPDDARARDFLDACMGVIGRDHVRSAAQSADWRRLTFPWPGRALAVLRPGSAEEALACLSLAGAFGCPLHPVSRGRAWGLGSRAPVSDAVMLDLSRLDRILDIDLLHGSVRVEPGVTFRQLHAALRAREAGWHVPAFGGPPDASVLANALDRGEGTGLFGDRFGQLWDLDVALTTGERLRTGFGRFEADRVAAIHGRPAGPLIEGLFSQSSFGCVLSGRLGLAPNTPHAGYITCEIGPPERLPAFVEVLRGLVRDQVIDSHDAFLWDGAKQVASVTIAREAPPEATSPQALGAWAATLTVRAAHEMLSDAKRAIAIQALLPVSDSVGLDDPDAATPRHHSGLYGHSDGANLTSCYWAKPSLPAGALDPDRDRCGFVWLCPVLPFEGGALQRLAAITGEVADRFGTFVMSGAEAVSVRALFGYVSLAWDRDEPGADERAMRGRDALAAAFAAEGFHGYRLAHPGIAAHGHTRGDWGAVVERLRRALDPGLVLGPGRVARPEGDADG
ncbi:FAD-binding oxidoreductase [Methylobacterium aquaticum]|uniref:FAD-binding PCMH-type domain-containing protein n=1 Tax=Methylobacterium aquaticum TaxID=270351 RepID=A0A0J6S3Q3_9HYPH|nr:FAD-binding protein [Methylobacterium aquaticum]KMO29825.1 hypothetical protein VP06_23470 [Methylobacterium aquaticum]